MLPPASEVCVEEALARAVGEGREVLLEPEVYALLAAAGIDVPAHRVVGGPDEVTGSALPPGDEVMVKVVSPDVLHKSDVGGVVACPNHPSAVRRAVARVLAAARTAVPAARLRGALVAERVRFRPGLGREVLLGLRHDPAFGAVVAVGVGGLDAEVLLGALSPGRARVIASAARMAAACATPEGARRLLRGTLVQEALAGGLRSSRGHAVSSEANTDHTPRSATYYRRHHGLLRWSG